MLHGFPCTCSTGEGGGGWCRKVEQVHKVHVCRGLCARACEGVAVVCVWGGGHLPRWSR